MGLSLIEQDFGFIDDHVCRRQRAQLLVGGAERPAGRVGEVARRARGSALPWQRSGSRTSQLSLPSDRNRWIRNRWWSFGILASS